MENRRIGRLKWNKFSAAYRGRLVEGAGALSAFLATRRLKWDALVTGRNRHVDETLELFVNELHESQAPGSLRVAKHAVLYIQVIRPRVRKSLQNTW